MSIPVTTVEQWLALPELPIPIVTTPRGAGRTYKVRKVGFLAAEPRDCQSHDLPVEANEFGRCPLPTCVVRQKDGNDVLYRLPHMLARWAEDLVAMAHVLGSKPLPSLVEFGLYEDRHYAEIR